jgi:hypothetical protein
MSTTVISNMVPFGAMTNATISRLVALNTTVPRLREATATASAGFQGEPGTQFEAVSAITSPGPGINLFGVQPNPDEPGAQGLAYEYAVIRLSEIWATFWADAEPFVRQLDNGIQSNTLGQLI